ncbi:MAG: hypothetical protein ABW321_34120 [Polyangiales bacterium]
MSVSRVLTSGLRSRTSVMRACWGLSCCALLACSGGGAIVDDPAAALDAPRYALSAELGPFDEPSDPPEEPLPEEPLPEEPLPEEPAPAAPVACPDADWTNALYVSAPDQAARALWAVMVSDSVLCVWVEGDSLDNHVLYVDSDANADTGLAASEWPEHSGADYAILNDSVQQLQVDGSWSPVSGSVALSKSSTELLFEIDLDSFPVRSQSELWIGFELLDAESGEPYSSLPPAQQDASFARVAIVDAASGETPATCTTYPSSAAGPSTTERRGLIIPAYVPLAVPTSADTGEACTTPLAKQAKPRSTPNGPNDKTPTDACMWVRLREGAARLGSAYDYWVTVNGPASGPFTQPSDWATAKTLWDPIKANGGRIVGYVHAFEGQTPADKAANIVRLRDLDTVMNEVTAWVNGYAGLDGIWLDEFYPRLELFSTAADTDPANPNPPIFPQPACYTPTDRAFMPDGKYNPGVQINPQGGFFHKLTTWIRATYPNLRIIGNAGGALYTNQLQYAPLVDILVSTERTYAAAAAGGSWAGLVDANLSLARNQLALIHSAVSEATDPSVKTQEEAAYLQTALSQASTKQYSHVYVAYKEPHPPKDPNDPNPPEQVFESIWGILPPFFEDEVDAVARGW